MSKDARSPENLERLQRLVFRLAPRFIGAEPEATFLERRNFFVFNLLDWVDDLNKAHSLFRSPSEFSDEQAWEIIFGLVSHASYHLGSAAALAGFDENPFQQDLEKLLSRRRPK